MQKVVVFFTAVFFGFYLLLSHATQVQSTAGELNKQYAKFLTNATQDAAQAMQFNNKTGTFMDRQDTRDEIIRIFFNTLSVMFDDGMLNRNYTKDEIESETGVHAGNSLETYLRETQAKVKSYVPAVIMVDTNGFYIWHGFYRDGEMKYEITPLTTWSKVVHSGATDYYVRYFLHDRVQIAVATGGTNKVFDGTTEYVKKKLQDAGLYSGSLNFLDTYDKYNEERNVFVAQSIQLQLMYYINNENTKIEADGIPDNDYYFELPTVSSGDWIEMVENPSIISFLQGNKFTDLYDFINVYSFAGGENKKITGFVAQDITGLSTGAKGFYHVKDKPCSILGTAAPNEYFSTRRGAAEEGYDPCPECNP